MKGRVLAVSASDSSGGAGIQADIKAVTALGGYAATAITALAIQDTKDVHGFFEVPADVVGAQMAAVLDDIGADCIKTGILRNAATIGTVTDIIEKHGGGVPVVVDPVMLATGGQELMSAADAQALKARLILHATILTPNVPEAVKLTGLDVHDVDTMMHAAEMLVTLGPKAVLVKGGHLEGDTVSDVLFDENGIEVLESPRSRARNTHGAGCTLASAIAVGLAQELSIRDAVLRAKAYLDEAIRTATDLGSGQGPINHGHTVQEYPGAD